MQIPDDRVRHVFRDAPGHLVDTPENRQLLIETASDGQNLIGIDQFGTSWYVRMLDDHRQVWVQVRGDEIRNGGVNQPPRTWSPLTGFSAKTRPQE